jgi:peptidoglycan/LPS O-acetylase OafA/YrhL
MLKNLHRLRGLAALVVVISHLAHWHYTALIGYYDKRLMGAGV